MYILGISAFYHDSAACLVKDGKIISAAQEERFTRKKHDSSFPIHAIQYCLENSGIGAADLDYAAFYDKPFLKFERLLESYLQFAPSGIRSFITSMPVWIKQKIWIKEIIQRDLGFRGKILFLEHHESHAASAFYPSPFQEAAFLTIDGVGEWTTTSFGIGDGNKISIIADMKFPHSLGLLYSAFTYYTGFKVNSGEYKMMGLAPYGRPKYKNLILKELIDLKEDGSFKMNMDYFNYAAGLTMTSDKFHKLFGGLPRKPESSIEEKHMDIASSIQEATEEIILKMTKHVYSETKQKYLCLGGGVALNCVANGRLLREGPFKDIWIQPAANDAGGALGGALLVWHKYLNNPRRVDGIRDSQEGSYLGPEFKDGEILRYLQDNNISFIKLSREEIPEKISDLIADGKVIGWFQGRMEFGPRALGARSILGDARSPEMQKLMNLKIKFRESFRPFAPSVIAERTADYFDIDRPSPYMLLTAQVKRERQKPLNEKDKIISGVEKVNLIRSDIPAVTHLDYSARLQTAHKETNHLYYEMIKAFDRKYGCPVIINTSFNVRGEPIVCSPEDAFRCFMRTDIDYLIMGSYLLDKKRQKPLESDSEWKKEYQLD